MTLGQACDRFDECIDLGGCCPGVVLPLLKDLLQLLPGNRNALVCGEAVERVTAKTVKLAGGRRLRSALTIWTGGPAPRPLLAESGLAAPGRWAAVADNLRLEGADDVFVAGDSGELPQPLARQAYHALAMGRHCAREIERAERGRAPRAARRSGRASRAGSSGAARPAPATPTPPCGRSPS